MKDNVEELAKKRGLEILLAQPAIAVSLFFMWLCGIILTYLLVGTNSKFSRHRAATESFWFRLAMGFMPAAVVMLCHHLIVYGKMITSVQDVSSSALPSVLIVASLTFIAFILRAFR